MCMGRLQFACTLQRYVFVNHNKCQGTPCVSSCHKAKVVILKIEKEC